MPLVEILATPGARLLTLGLAHFVWQGAAVAALLYMAVELCRVRQAHARYAASLLALAVMLACPPVTLAWLWYVQPADVVQLHHTPLGLVFVADNHSAVWAAPTGMAAVQPYALATWLAGVAILAFRLLLGAAAALRLRRDRLPLPPDLVPLVARLGRWMHIDAVSLVRLSPHVSDALAVGLLKPLVLVPISWATELPPPMLEAVIAHELAHLRRRDLWVNLLQRIAETLLFYHPAVWWLSRRLRIERELCADELAVAATGQRLVYAQTLEQVALRRRAEVRPLLAAFMRGGQNMRLLERVQNVLDGKRGQVPRMWPAGLAALVLPIGLWTAAWWLPTVKAEDERMGPTVRAFDFAFPAEGAEGGRTAEARVFSMYWGGLQEDDAREGVREASRRRGDERDQPRDGDLRRERDHGRGDGDARRDGDLRRERDVRRDGERGPREDAIRRDGERDERTERGARRDGDRPPRERERLEVDTIDGITVLRGDRRTVAADVERRQIEELTAMVQRLSQQVRKLEAELNDIRSGKRPAERTERERPEPLGIDGEESRDAAPATRDEESTGDRGTREGARDGRRHRELMRSWIEEADAEAATLDKSARQVEAKNDIARNRRDWSTWAIDELRKIERAAHDAAAAPDDKVQQLHSLKEAKELLEKARAEAEMQRVRAQQAQAEAEVSRAIAEEQRAVAELARKKAEHELAVARERAEAVEKARKDEAAKASDEEGARP